MFSYPHHYQPSVVRTHNHHSHHPFGNKFIADIQTTVSNNSNNNNTVTKCDFESNSLLTTTSTITAINSMGSSSVAANQLNHHNIGQ